MSQHRVNVPGSGGAPSQTIVVNVRQRGWLAWVLFGFLAFSGMLNLILLFFALPDFTLTETPPPLEYHHSGDADAARKIAIIEISGTIMPPFTERVLDAIDYAAEQSDVRGVLLVVDSPGGLVADSHQIYHRLTQLREKKPVYVAMQRMAASGGYYVAMGAGPEGRIFAEPTTWTGSIGVIIPHYDVSQLAEEFGVQSEPLVTGPYKDSLSPFREISPEERAVWEEILDDAFVRFQDVIVEGRGELDADEVTRLATGRIFTAEQAVENGLIDEIGYVDDALQALQQKLNLREVHVVKYEYPISFTEALLGAHAQRQADPFQRFLEAGVPRAMYFCGWDAALSATRQ